MGINNSTVYNWIKELDEQIGSSKCEEENKTEEKETDWSALIGDKHKNIGF